MVDSTNDKVTILKTHVVTNVDWSDQNQAVVACSNGQSFNCDFVISTVSLGYLKEHHQEMFHPELPFRKAAAIESFCYGTIARIKLDFPEVFWDPENPGIHILWR